MTRLCDFNASSFRDGPSWHYVCPSKRKLALVRNLFTSKGVRWETIKNEWQWRGGGGFPFPKTPPNLKKLWERCHRTNYGVPPQKIFLFFIRATENKTFFIQPN